MNTSPPEPREAPDWIINGSAVSDLYKEELERINKPPESPSS